MAHDYYNRANFPRFVVNRGAWDIYANESGYCASIPVSETSGHKASHFGDLAYVRVTLARELAAQADRAEAARALAFAVQFGAELSRDISENGSTCDAFEHSLALRAAIRVMALEAALAPD